MVADSTEVLREAVLQAFQARRPLCIRAGGSKDFYGRPPFGERLDVSAHRGIIRYEPTELVLTVRAGTPLAVIEKQLAEHGQMLPFEPPHFGPTATIGGTIACGLSGPRRPWSGAARDLVLGVRMLNGRGECLRFGGEVMKNVAGYDVSRLMCGALGTLGLLLDISIKVLPRPECVSTVVLAMDAPKALARLAMIARSACPVSAAMHCDHRLWLRLAGTESGVAAARAQLGGELEDNAVWHGLREHTLDFFRAGAGDLWRLSLPPATPHLTAPGPQLLDWGGAQRWFFHDPADDPLRELAAQYGGHAQRFRTDTRASREDFFHPLNPAQLALHRAVKRAFDPHVVCNRGRLYAELDR